MLSLLQRSSLFFLSLASIGMASEEAPLFRTTERMGLETSWVLGSIEGTHYSNLQFRNKDPERIVRSFIESLDPQRMYFLQSEVDELVLRFGNTLHTHLSQRNLFPAFRIFQDYRRHTLERINWVFDRLEQDFEFFGDADFRPDRSKLDWPSSREEAESLWDRRLHFEMLNELLPLISDVSEVDFKAADESGDASLAEAVAEARETLHRRYTRWREQLLDMDSTQVQELFLTSVTQSYDPHSTFLSADSFEEMFISLRNSLVGIGAVLTDEDGVCVVRELVSNGPADLTGELAPGDRILAVAQGDSGEFIETIGMSLRRIVRMIRGEAGSVVRLLIQPAEAADPSVRREVRIVRDEVKLTANLASARLFQVPAEDGEMVAVGVISLPSFYGGGGGARSTTEDVRELIERLENEGVDSIVLDFRRNGGGLLNEAISLTSLFIPEGPVVQVRNTHGMVRGFDVGRNRIAWEGPLAILVSRFTASAAEIVAGALQDHRRAIVVGDTSTHGKGTVQDLFASDRALNPLLRQPPVVGAKVTVYKYYLPSGNSTQNKGVRSDIVFPSVNEFLPVGEADLPNALLWDSIDAQNWNFGASLKGFAIPIDDSVLDFLSARSQQRQAELEEFQFLRETIDWFREQRDREVFSLNLITRLEEKETETARQEAFRERRRQLARNPFSYELFSLTSADEGHTAQVDTPADPMDVFLDDTDMEESEAEEESSNDRIDIHLREALRIAADLVAFKDKSARQAGMTMTSSPSGL